MIKDEKPKAAAFGGQTPDDWQKVKATPEWLFRAAKVYAHWNDSQVVSESEYEAGLQAFLNIPMR